MNFDQLSKIISGGQTGADRAALDWAIASGLNHGGWCPKGRRTDDGILDDKYQLIETESVGYRQRTRKNVEDSDGTLILNMGELTGGTLETAHFAQRFRKPLLVVQLDSDSPDSFVELATTVRIWVGETKIKFLNVAGPRESKRPGIYDRAMQFLTVLGLQAAG